MTPFGKVVFFFLLLACASGVYYGVKGYVARDGEVGATPTSLATTTIEVIDDGVGASGTSTKEATTSTSTTVVIATTTITVSTTTASSTRR